MKVSRQVSRSDLVRTEARCRCRVRAAALSGVPTAWSPGQAAARCDSISACQVNKTLTTMGPRLFTRSTRELISSILLVALVFRGLVPAGFMPASDRPFSIEICHDGFPTQLLSHDGTRHSGGPSYFEHCLFGGGLTAAPTPHVAAVLSVALNCFGSISAVVPSLVSVRLLHVPQARAPPPFV